jgi:protein-tyrosine phosphatase
MIDERFGTARGLVRLALSYAEVATRQAAILPHHPDAVTRLVFVCHGNICRSAFAHAVAERLGANVASFGLSTASGKTAHGPAIEAANAMGVSLHQHRTTRVEDFIVLPGDLLIGMETRHLRKMASIPALSATPRTLLGLWAAPPIPHIHDPYRLDPRYMATCLRRIEQATERLVGHLANARRDKTAH